MTWRDRARPIIARVIAETGGDDLKLVRKALREAYPFGERAMHPYKVWCSEVNRQLGTQRIKADDRQLSLEAKKESEAE